MKRIPLSQGKTALVDDEDFGWLSQYKWYFDRYAWRYEKNVDGSRRRVAMHREVLGLSFGDGVEVDHRDRNKLNNQKGNLRKGRRKDNNGNRNGVDGTSKFKGVSFRKDTGKWRAYGTEKDKYVSLGSFTSEEEAARVYDRWARKYFGEFAKLNFGDVD
jgi:hypothetical protein